MGQELDAFRALCALTQENLCARLHDGRVVVGTTQFYRSALAPEAIATTAFARTSWERVRYLSPRLNQPFIYDHAGVRKEAAL
jgi:hypothetical protein